VDPNNPSQAGTISRSLFKSNKNAYLFIFPKLKTQHQS